MKILLGLGLILATIFLQTFTSHAAPVTPHFDPLIAELQSRSLSLSNSTDAAVIKQWKAVNKALKVFSMTSISIKTDMKMAKKAAKILAKAFPDEFNPPTPESLMVSTNLADLLQLALDAFGGDVGALLAAAQSLLDAAFDGACKTKAQAILDAVQTELAAAAEAPDLASLIAALSKATTQVLKGENLVEAALNCVPGGGNWYDWTFRMTVDGTPVVGYEDGRTGGPDTVNVNLFSNGLLDVGLYKGAGMPVSANFHFVPGNPGKAGTYTVSGQFSKDTNSYTITSGQAIVASFPKSLPGRLKFTFSFTATGTAGTVNVANGSVSVWLYDPY